MERSRTLRFLHHWPTRFLCIALVIIQAASINWYLMDNITSLWAVIYCADAVVIVLFVTSFVMAASNSHHEKHVHRVTLEDSTHLPLTYIAWLVYAIILDVKVAVIFSKFSTRLDEDSFFGPNTLKTSIALAGLIFLTHLSAQHDLRLGDKRKLFLLLLTGSVLFDVLDGVDMMENLFDEAVRDTFPPGLDDAMIATVCINFILPTIPLFTLAATKFGLRPLPEKLEIMHKLALAYLVNLPFFVCRMITWHGLSQGISIFSLKNLIAMGIVTFEVLEKWFTQAEEGNEEASEQGRQSRHNSISHTERTQV